MSFTSRRMRSVAAAALTVGLALGIGACSAKKDDGDAGNNDTGPVTISLSYFGTPGFTQAVKDFEAANPNIKVDVKNEGQTKDFVPKLAQQLSAGSGASDVVMLEEGMLLQYLKDNKPFVNLLDLGAKSLENEYLPFKWKNAFTADGNKLVGLGTDVGPLAMCYRTDLFQQAGLPTERDKVSALWKTWDDYVKTGETFKSKNLKATWLDSATSVMQPYIMQNSDTWFYDKSDKYIGDTNPVVKTAYNLGLDMASKGLTSKLARWSTDWDAAFKNAAFATVPCPPWYTGVIKERAGDAGKNKWDIATIPGGGGNWGGSYLGIPTQSKHQKQAFELIKFLTGKQGGIDAFKEAGPLPSSQSALADPQITGATNDYFNNAPVGKIYVDAAKTLKPIYLGPKHQALWENAFEPAMQAAEQGKLSAQAGWDKAIKDSKALAEG
ncbi:ABC transporter substrate-binding protein [Dactylosporangium matsuzakiense]|uniref:ABC transporter substrate-binding protein n=1 Tax=Dactylosporangium matsuzakiense TaxID=53360 RepID=A0A9W6KI06_9ACTN|nr:extracellular solute-binding protein [Dactylosporangium matsuzakiense]UWZ46552.1 extracellular solute-binding protein [Dactylosporangium matsuzakiense]GLL01327.1 ABC transporter substrate-binding protein [Dactylosporangium matsuzakiense]